MDNRKKLHDYSIVMICFSVLNVFTFLGTVISTFIDGSFDKSLNSVEADIVGIVKIVLIIFGVLMMILALSDAFIGLKGLKVSREPNADKGYIVVAKIFFVLNVIAVISSVASLINNTTPIIDGILSLANTVLDVIVYALFIKAATAVRRDVIK